MGNLDYKDIKKAPPFHYADFMDAPAREGETKIIRHPEVVHKDLEIGYPGMPGVFTLDKAWERTVARFPNDKFLGKRDQLEATKFSEYKWHTFKQTDEEVKKLLAGFLKLKLCPKIFVKDHNKNFKFIGIFARNRPEWVIAEIAALYDSVTTVAIPGIDVFEYNINTTEVATLISETCNLNNILPILKKKTTPTLKNMVLLRCFEEKEKDIQDFIAECKLLNINCFFYDELLTIGEKYLSEIKVDIRALAEAPEKDSYLTMVFTSGTTGTPKGVPLSHFMIITNEQTGLITGSNLHNGDREYSYLPYSHIYGQRTLVNHILAGSTIGFYSGNIKYVVEDCQLLKPTIFMAVPRVLERIFDAFRRKAGEGGDFKKKLFENAINWKIYNYEHFGSYKHWFIDNYIFKEYRDMLGGCIRFLGIGSAPAQDLMVKSFKVILGLPVINGYGQTEMGGSTLCTVPEEYKVGIIGGPLKFVELKLIDVPGIYTSKDVNPITKEYEPRGELCIRGPTVFKGYFKSVEKTKEIIDEEGWFHTGDVATIYPSQGCAVKIIDRVKNIFKLSQGEFILPENIQENLKNNSKYVDQIFVCGNSAFNYLCALVSPKKEKIAEFLNSIGITDFKNEDIEKYYDNEKVIKEVLTEMEKQGRAHGLKGYEVIKKIHLVKEPFTAENGLLTPTLKMKTIEINKRYSEVIKRFYS